MTVQYVYVVTGNTGEYSDWRTWTVAAYLHRDTAEQHCTLCNDVTRCTLENEDGKKERREDEEGGEDKYEAQARVCQAGNPYDPKMEVDYTGTEYAVEEVLLAVHVDQFLDWLPCLLPRKD